MQDVGSKKDMELNSEDLSLSSRELPVETLGHSQSVGNWIAPSSVIKALHGHSRFRYLFAGKTSKPESKASFLAKELFKKKGDTRNEVYARVGQIRAQSETMSYVEVFQMIEKEMEISVAKADSKLMLWCLVQKGYTDLEINAASANAPANPHACSRSSSTS
jgi:hypothetical protein